MDALTRSQHYAALPHFAHQTETNHMDEEATYLCDACGEEIVIPIDLTAGSQQEYVEDCPVCCRPHLIHVEIEPDGSARVWAELEQR